MKLNSTILTEKINEWKFKGYSHKYDEWRPYEDNNFHIMLLERTFEPSETSLEDRLNIYYREVKRKIIITQLNTIGIRHIRDENLSTRSNLCRLTHLVSVKKTIESPKFINKSIPVDTAC